MLSPDPLSPIPSSSAIRTSDPQSPGHSASLAEIKETSENMQGDPDIPEPGTDIKMEYLS
jgi:hypothetical protein